MEKVHILSLRYVWAIQRDYLTKNLKKTEKEKKIMLLLPIATLLAMPQAATDGVELLSLPMAWDHCLRRVTL